jgi:hypothetical protein
VSSSDVDGNDNIVTTTTSRNNTTLTCWPTNKIKDNKKEKAREVKGRKATKWTGFQQ